MRIRTQLLTLLAAALGAGLLAAPVAGASGGASPDAVPGLAQLGNPLQTATAGGITLSARTTALVNGRVALRGTAPAATGGVRIERRDPRRGWVVATAATVQADGSWAVTWRPTQAGATALRALPADAPLDGGTSAGGTDGAGDAADGRSADGGDRAALDGDDAAAAAGPQLVVRVYRSAIASWFGPGHYGSRTACGQVLRRGALGVAHRTLPCGTRVALYYRGRTLVVPVIDRGPFVAGRTWDLTVATHTAIGGDDGLIKLGALALTDAEAAGFTAKRPG